ncbi:MAG: hypothetical protein JRN61_02015 [Nitrososphaerota archaeon]|nr:hypothetical protein [Nitrososphaerota archaeon]
MPEDESQEDTQQQLPMPTQTESLIRYINNVGFYPIEFVHEDWAFSSEFMNFALFGPNEYEAMKHYIRAYIPLQRIDMPAWLSGQPEFIKHQKNFQFFARAQLSKTLVLSGRESERQMIAKEHREITSNQGKAGGEKKGGVLGWLRR